MFELSELHVENNYKFVNGKQSLNSIAAISIIEFSINFNILTIFLVSFFLIIYSVIICLIN